MNIYWCPSCGFEDSINHSSCGSCGMALSEGTGLFLVNRDDVDETGYELDLKSPQRADLVTALIGSEIAHRWDATDELVVATSDEETVDALLDDVLNEDIAIELIDPDDEGAAGDATADAEGQAHQEEDSASSYELMNAVFESSERLLKKWNAQDVGAFISDATALSMMSPPLGVDAGEWVEVAVLARNCAVALQDDDQADVEQQVTELRSKLHTYL